MIDQTLFVRDTEGRYAVAGPNDILAAARAALARTVFRRGAALTSPNAAREAVQLHLADREYEVFAVLFLDNQHRLLAFEELFQGTIDSATVYPREVVKKSLALNAAAVIFAHNHPSGVAEPSEADRHITRKLQQALELVEVRVLDHFIVGEGTYSFAEHGLI